MPARHHFWIALFLFMTAPARAAELPELFRSDFAKDKLDGWKMADPGAWSIANSDHGPVLALTRQSDYRPRVRSPVNYALIERISLSDFELELEMKSTTRDYDHRDLCLFFGYRDPEHFYYVHFGKRADLHAHSVFLVDGKARISIAKERTKGTPWTDGWHRVKLVRDVANGAIRVYFDEDAKPIMVAEDKTFLAGQVGVGSFDDTGMFANIVLRGQKVP